MTAVLNELKASRNGISKKDAHATLMVMAEQLRFIDQKLKVNVDREVWMHFQKEIHQIDYTKNAIEKLNG